jgi:hypothetical protein
VVQRSKKLSKKVPVSEFDNHHFFDMASVLIVLLTAVVRMTGRSDLYEESERGRAARLDLVINGLVEELRYVVGEGFPGTTHE